MYTQYKASAATESRPVDNCVPRRPQVEIGPVIGESVKKYRQKSGRSSMFRRSAPLVCALVVASCGDGSNPVTGGTEDGAPVGGLNGTSLVTGDVGSFTYDAETDQLVINNLPFDGPDGVYTNTGVAAVTGFNVYESTETDETGQRKFFAVFRQSDSGSVSAGAVGTGDYAAFGFGGGAISRSTNSVAVPNSGEAVYTGEYGGLRVVEGSAGENDINLVSGDATIDVDFADFDVTGAVEGRITNREFYDVNGNLIGTLPTIVLATGNINADGTIGQSSATTFDSNGDPLQTGTYDALFGGPNGSEIAGIIVITGPETEGADTEVQETGVFTVVD